MPATSTTIFSRGFRFNPSPEEAIAYYLPRLLAGGGTTKLHEAVRPYIHVVADLYRHEPDDLVRGFEPLPVTGARFFFATCKKRSRAAPGGRSTWHSGGTVLVRDAAGAKIGECRKLRHKMDGAYTEWLMDEIVSSSSRLLNGDTEVVFCKMYVSPRATTTAATSSASAMTTRQDSAAAADAPGGVVLTQPLPQSSFPVPLPTNSFASAPAVSKPQAAPKNNFAVPAAAYLQAVAQQQVPPNNNFAVAAPRAPSVLTQQAPSRIYAAPPAANSFAVPVPRAHVVVKPAALNGFTAPRAHIVVKSAAPNGFTAPAPRGPVITMATQAAPKQSFKMTAPPATPAFTTPQAAPAKRPAPQVAVPPCPKRARDAHPLPPINSFTVAAPPAVVRQQLAAAAYTTNNRGFMAPASTPSVTPSPSPAAPAQPSLPASEDPCFTFEDGDDDLVKTIEDSLLEVIEEPPPDLTRLGAEEEEPAAAQPSLPASEDPSVTFEDDHDDLVKMIEDDLEVIEDVDDDLLAKMQAHHSPSPAPQLVAPTAGCTTASFPAPPPGRSQAPPRRRALLYKEQMPSFLVSAPRPRAATNNARNRSSRMH